MCSPCGKPQGITSLKDRLLNIASTKFDDKLLLEDFHSLDSRTNLLLQIADLFAASLNRVLNHDTSTSHPKNLFSNYFLERIQYEANLTEFDINDKTHHIFLRE